MNAALPPTIASPAIFEGADASGYRRWREHKLEHAAQRAEDLIVEVGDPGDLTDAEVAEIGRRCAIANMAIYAGPPATNKEAVRRLGARLGLQRLHANPLADEDGITSLEARPEKSARGFIPYSNRRLLWHTDGYYNAPQERIGAFLLHCAQPAARGGANRLLDHEIAWLLLRDADPAFVEALSAPDALTIPAHAENGVELRAARTGPVFSTHDGALHMRYTARTRSIEWKDDAKTRDAVACLAALLESCPYARTVRLSAGQGLVCNNVLHDRSAFEDDPAAPRLVYRARYGDRVDPR